MAVCLKHSIAFLLLLAISSAANAANSLVLVPLEMNDKLVTLISGQDDPVPEGKLRFIGNFNEPSFSIPTLDNITVRDSAGNMIPLKIEESSLVEEFGATVSLWLSFDIPADVISKDKALTLEWGNEVSAKNTRVKNIKADPSSVASYRTFTWRKKNDRASFATIEVIADSNADYYFLWYLLPMLLIFIVLTIRKMSTNRIPENASK